MRRSNLIAWSLAAWAAVGIFWFFATRSRHPTLGLAIIVTASLMVAYAGASYVNHLVLMPRLRASRSLGRYLLSLLLVMTVFTAAALSVIRVSYLTTLGPDPDPNGVYNHYAIDLFGMAVHLAGAALIVRGFRFLNQPQSTS